MRPALLLCALLAVFGFADAAHAQQVEFKRVIRSGEERLYYRWRDHGRQEFNTSFTLDKARDVLARRLDLNHAARRDEVAEVFRLVVFLQLVGREQPAVRDARALIFGVDDALDLGFERVANGVEKIRQRRITGSFLRRPAQRGDLGEVGFQRVHCE